MTVTEWQAEYNGLLTGDGTSFDLTQVDGLLDLPEVRTSDRSRLLTDGALPGHDNLSARSVTLSYEVWGQDSDDLASLVGQFQAAFRRQRDDETPFTFRFPGVAGGGTRLINARCRKRSAPLDLDFLNHKAAFVVQLDASDPLIYDASENAATAGLPTGAGGMTFPATFPLSFGAQASGGSIYAVNEGFEDSLPRFRIAGPLPDFTLTNLTTGQTWSASLPVASGQWVDVDFARRTVLLNGTGSRWNSVPASAEWWALAPGTNEIAFRASSYATGTATAYWRSAWA